MARDDDDASELVATAATDEVLEAPPPVAQPREAATAAATGRSAMVVTAGILLSRLVGLVRQRITAYYFGTGDLADVITAAFRVGNITQNLLGEGTLSASFIPIYAKLRAAGKVKEARHFALSALGLLGAAALVASALGAALAPWLTHALAAGFTGDKLAVTVRMVRIVFPMTGLLVLSAWCLGVQNAHRRFFLPYAAPVLWSLAQIAALLYYGPQLSKPGQPSEDLAIALAGGALVGAGLQLAILLPAAGKLVGELRPRLDTKDPNVREAGKRLPAVLLGRGVIQLSGLLDTLLVTFLSSGDNASFGYAQTVYLLPMSLLGTGEAAAALPEMASGSAEEDEGKRNAALRAQLGASLARVTTLTIPATLVFLLLGRQLIAVLLKGGDFGDREAERVEVLLAAYGLALLGNAAGRVLITAAYAIGDAKTPARYAVYRVVASTAVAAALAFGAGMGVLGVVLGAVAAAWVETGALAWKLGRRLGGLGLERVPIVKILILGVASIAPAVGLKMLLPDDFARGALGGLVVLTVFGAAFAIAAPLLGLFSVKSLLRRRR